MIFTNSAIRAYYHGAPSRTGCILISTDHHSLNDGFSMPKLDDFFLTVTSLVRTFKFKFMNTGDIFVIYYHDPAFPTVNSPLEMIVFRKGVTPGKLVNIRSSDGAFINHTIQRFLDRRLNHGPRTIIPTIDKIITTKGLISYYYGQTKCMVPIPTEQIMVDKPFSIPRLTGWFGDDTKITSAFVVSDEIRTGQNATKFFVLCSQFDFTVAPTGRNNCELLIFRKSVTTDALVNMRGGDEKHMDAVVKCFFED